MKVKLVVWWYIVTSFLLFLYSFTQVDLGLTLSKLSVWQSVQKSFQYIGYFQRPVSTWLFIGLIISFFASFLLLLVIASKNKVSKRLAWITVFATTVILMFSYNAFSYDLFNYIFDAKIVTHYHLNPYAHKALDFAGDPMLGFMHWTDRTYPYGPLWLMLTIPLSYIGLQYFLLTFFLFKMLMAAAYIGTVWFVSKMSRIIRPKDEVFTTVLFALNPLVVIESLVSAHNDIVMMFFAVWGFYFVMNNKNIRGFLMLIASMCIKFATIILAPIFLFVFISKFIKKEIDWEKIMLCSSLLLIIPVVLASVRTNFQPWYILFVLPFAGVLGKKYYSVIPTIVFSLFCLLEYVPFLYTGNWNKPIPTILFWLQTFGIFLSLIFILLWRLKIAFKHK